MWTVPLGPATMRVSPCLLLGEVKWFIGGYRRQETEEFLPVLSKDLPPFFFKVSVYVPGHCAFFNHKNRGTINQSEELMFGKSPNRQMELKRRQIRTLV